MGGYVNDIIENLPKSQQYKSVFFNHINAHQCSWPSELIAYIDSYSSETLSRTIQSRYSIRNEYINYDIDAIKKINLGYYLKNQADEAVKYALEYYNNMWVDPCNLPDGFMTCHLIEAIRLEMIPIYLHRRSLLNCSRYTKSIKERSINLDRMYNNSMSSVDKNLLLPTGW